MITYNGKPVNYTTHVSDRMNRRHFSLEDIKQTIEHGTYKPSPKDATAMEVEYMNFIVVISEKAEWVNVVTCKYNRKFTRLAEKYGKETGLGFYKAIQMLRENKIDKVS